MTDDQIINNGGTERDIEQYSYKNGADLTEEDLRKMGDIQLIEAKKMINTILNKRKLQYQTSGFSQSTNDLVNFLIDNTGWDVSRGDILKIKRLFEFHKITSIEQIPLDAHQFRNSVPGVGMKAIRILDDVLFDLRCNQIIK